MNTLEAYYAALDARAEAFRAEAAQAEARGDERAHSLALMRASMLGDMLKVLGRVEHDGRRGMLQAQIDRCEQQARQQAGRGDYDAADRERIKAETIRWARETLEKLEAEHG